MAPEHGRDDATLHDADRPRRGSLNTDSLDSGDAGLDAAYARLAEASRPVGKARVAKVNRDDLRLVVGQFRILVADVKRLVQKRRDAGEAT